VSITFEQLESGVRFGGMEALKHEIVNAAEIILTCPWSVDNLRYVCMVCRQFVSILVFFLWVCLDLFPRNTRVHFPQELLGVQTWDWECLKVREISFRLLCLFLWKCQKNLHYLNSCPTDSITLVPDFLSVEKSSFLCNYGESRCESGWVGQPVNSVFRWCVHFSRIPTKTCNISFFVRLSVVR
jgi:hypothetical protein